MYAITFNVPTTHLEVVKEAIFQAGAGRVGNYSHCSWQVLGEGQFMPLEGSQAYIGSVGKLEKVAEYKVESICEESIIQEVIAALLSAHPYEEPSYEVWKMEEF
jgi:structural toxin protein (hemagglutinin/hemolysin) RtxA